MSKQEEKLVEIIESDPERAAREVELEFEESLDIKELVFEDVMDEMLLEMEAAFEPGTTVVDVVTGETYQIGGAE